MANRNKKYSKRKKNQKIKQTPKSLIDIVILLAYGYITIITPDFKAYDANGPKFLALAALNLLVWGYLIYKRDKYFTDYPLLQFFRTKIGMAYGLLLLISLVSSVKAINVAESVIPFFKMFTTFSATWIIAIVLLRDKSYLKYLAIGMAALLIFDSLRVFAETQQYIKGEISSISLIKAGYSNKNILAAALFIKLAFGLWLFSLYKGWLKKFGLIAIFTGSIAVLFMSARAFYLGLIFLSIAYIAWLIVRYIQTKEKQFLKNSVVYGLSLFLSFLVFTTVQSTFYPKNRGGYTGSVAGRLSTVTKENSGGGRLKYWRMTGEMIKENPLLGIGIGNWKIHVVDKENGFRGSFGSFYKVHNDFLEITSESGIFAGLMYIVLFLLIFYYFLQSIFRRKSEPDIKLFFIPAVGMFAYIFDAFFNFPHDRPEIQSLFAIFLGTGIAISVLQEKENKELSTETNPGEGAERRYSKWNKPVQFIIPVVMIAAIYFLYLDVVSLQLQRIWKFERESGKVIVNSDHFINNFPKIPTLGADGGEPVKMMIVKKLQQEKKYEKMLEYLHSPYPNPFDSKLEFFTHVAHLGLNNQDSALYYMDKAYHKKPYAYLYVKQYCNLLEKNEKRDEAMEIMNEYITRVKNEKEAWLYATRLNHMNGKRQKAAEIVDSAIIYFPKDTSFIKLQNYYYSNR